MFNLSILAATLLFVVFVIIIVAGGNWRDGISRLAECFVQTTESLRSVVPNRWVAEEWL